jgi:hypothetical protein
LPDLEHFVVGEGALGGLAGQALLAEADLAAACSNVRLAGFRARVLSGAEAYSAKPAVAMHWRIVKG